MSGDSIDCCRIPSATASQSERSPSTALKRRQLLRAGMVGGAALLGGGALAACSPTAETPIAAAQPPSPKGLQLVILGTRGGLPPGSARAGIASALVVDGDVYMVDCGYAAAWQYQRSGLLRQSLKKIFVTHLHADHLADYYNMIMLGAVTGIPSLGVIPEHVAVYGPGPAGGLPAPFGGKSVPTVNPSNPTPGIKELTEYCHSAYAYSSNMYMRDAGMRDIRELVDPQEISVPDVGASPTGTTAPRMKPFAVMEDNRVKVSAILVPHGPVFPSFAFRFDTDYGSVTFSGDTRYSQNVIDLAHGSDVLVHEAISDPAEIHLPDAIRSHMLQSHTLVSQVGSIANKSDVGHLVLSHIGDFTGHIDTAKWTKLAQHDFHGKVSVGQELNKVRVKS